MAEAVPETIREAKGAAEVLARPSVFMATVAIIAIGGVAALVWRDEVRADAQIAVLQGMSQHIADLDGDLRAAGVPVGQTQKKRLAVQASQRADVE